MDNILHLSEYSVVVATVHGSAPKFGKQTNFHGECVNTVFYVVAL